MNKFKIKNTLTIDGIIKLFEENSPNANVIKDMKKFMNKMIFVGIVYVVIICIIKDNTIGSLLFVMFFSFGTIIYICNTYGKISYQYSKKFGGKPYNFFSKGTSSFNIMSYNRQLMQEQEIKMLNQILKANKLKNIESMKEIRNYLIYNKKNEEMEESEFWKMIIGVYAIPITFGIISIYTALCNNSELAQNIINIGYIVVGAMCVIGIVYIIYCISRIKKLSVTNSYSYPKLILLLTELIIKENYNKN